MASSVYSTRFICSSAADFNGTYTVPAGFRAVVHTITAACASPVTAYYVYLANDTLGVTMWISTFPSDNNAAIFNGRIVFNELEVMQTFGTNPGAGSVQVSGYLLTLP